jgi:hypothetical protein
MTEIENEWKRLQEHLRLVAESGTCEYVCTPAGILKLEQIRLRAVAAGLRKYAIVFARLPSANPYVSDEPKKVTWRLEGRTASGRFVWFVDQLDKALATEELAQTILTQLELFCSDYEKEIQW